ncbi:MAG: 16S rRNA processing protein RimM [Acidobacteria bacterium]|nr:16S rRNA processing protein RimM [Acidobacteriota bacterium]
MIAEPDVAKIEDFISIARIARPQGIRGEVIADILTDFPDRFAELDEITITRGGAVLGVFKLENHWFHKGRVVLKFVGYDDADKAETLRDASLVIRPDELVELDEDEYFVFDLEGCEVVTGDGHFVGTVARVEDYGAAPLLAVKGQDKEILIPLTHDICPEVDTANKKIVVIPPDGLLDL